jgi:hypothetical protein
MNYQHHRQAAPLHRLFSGGFNSPVQALSSFGVRHKVTTSKTQLRHGEQHALPGCFGHYMLTAWFSSEELCTSQRILHAIARLEVIAFLNTKSNFTEEADAAVYSAHGR